MVVLKLLQSMSKMIINPPEVFAEQILQHFRECGDSMYDRIKGWMDMSNTYNKNNLSSISDVDATDINSGNIFDEASKQKIPEFSLVPASRGFCLTLVGLLDTFHKKVIQLQEMQQSTK